MQKHKVVYIYIFLQEIYRQIIWPKVWEYTVYHTFISYCFTLIWGSHMTLIPYCGKAAYTLQGRLSTGHCVCGNLSGSVGICVYSVKRAYIRSGTDAGQEGLVCICHSSSFHWCAMRSKSFISIGVKCFKP